METIGNAFKTLFFGSDIFSQHSLKALLREQKSRNSPLFQLKLISRQENPNFTKSICVYFPHSKTHKNPVWHFSRETRLDTIIGDLNDDDLVMEFQKFDIAVVSSFGQLLPKRVVESFKKGAINVHPSLLPKYRGASPIQYTILNGDEVSGISIIEVDPCRFDRESDFVSLVQLMGVLGGEELVCTLKDYDKYKKNAKSQDLFHPASYAKKIPPEMSKLNFNETAKLIYAKFRAFGHMYNLNSKFRGMKFRIDGVKSAPYFIPPDLVQKLYGEEIPPGLICYSNNSLYIKCLDAWIFVGAASVGNKPFLSPKDLHNGYKINGTDILSSE